MKKILVVEDDVSLLKAYREMFKPEEFQMIEASNGQDGIARVNEEKPDVILLDIMLPGGMNGFDVLEQLKKNSATKQIPVIVTTNLDTEEKVAKTIGACGYIVKSDTTKDELVKIAMSCLNSSLSAKT